ncbi:MAG: hypothetical protein N4A61_07245 [Pelagimonas sp.]|jgi:hypothetical protein|nr:hypothetical protein [Pelagimonas sp.]
MTLYQFHTWMRAGQDPAIDGKHLNDWILVERDGDTLQISSSIGLSAQAKPTAQSPCKSTTVALFAAIDPDTGDEVFELSDQHPAGLSTRGRFRGTSGEARLTRVGSDLQLKLNGRVYVSAQRHSEQEAFLDLMEIVAMNSLSGAQSHSRLG